MPSKNSATKLKPRTKSDADRSEAPQSPSAGWTPKVVAAKPAAYQQSLEEAFPEVDPGMRPFGSKVLIQLRQPPKKSRGGIIFTPDTQDTEKWNTIVGKVIALGPCAFRNRNTLDPWPEGPWTEVGKFLWIPKYGGQRHEPFIPGTDERAHFIILNDLDLIGDYTIDPREVMGFLRV